MQPDLFTQPYFNTTAQSGDTLATYTRKAKVQSELVLNYFKQLPGAKFTADMVWAGLIARKLIPANTPVTSCRRAVTVLKNDGVLIKLSEMALGTYGRPAHLYTLKTETT